MNFYILRLQENEIMKGMNYIQAITKPTLAKKFIGSARRVIDTYKLLTGEHGAMMDVQSVLGTGQKPESMTFAQLRQS